MRKLSGDVKCTPNREVATQQGHVSPLEPRWKAEMVDYQETVNNEFLLLSGIIFGFVCRLCAVSQEYKEAQTNVTQKT